MRKVTASASALALGAVIALGSASSAFADDGPWTALKTCGSLYVGGQTTGYYDVRANAVGVLQTGYFNGFAGRVDAQSTSHGGNFTAQATDITSWGAYCSQI